MVLTVDLALFNLGIDSKLRGIDLLKLKVKDAATGVSIQSRAMIICFNREKIRRRIFECANCYSVMQNSKVQSAI